MLYQPLSQTLYPSLLIEKPVFNFSLAITFLQFHVIPAMYWRQCDVVIPCEIKASARYDYRLLLVFKAETTEFGMSISHQSGSDGLCGTVMT